MINLFYNEHDAEWEAWIDVEDDPKNGVCLGSGSTKTEALFRASLALHSELNVIRELMLNQFDGQESLSGISNVVHFDKWGNT